MAFLDDRVPSLVQYCQRVAAGHVDAISSLGDELRYDLVKPILERCTVEQLLRLEQASPYLQKDTPEIWKELCLRTYPSAAERYRRGEIEEPESWKDQYFVLVEEEARRIEEVGSKIRRQRLEAEERKKETEIKITTQMPPARRRWGVSVQPKTLFQKTKSEASRLQKNMYAKPMLPPMPPSGKNYRVLPPDNSIILPASESGVASGRVTVNTVMHRVSAPGSSPAPAARSLKTPASQTSLLYKPPPSQQSSPPSTSSLSIPRGNNSVSLTAASSKPPPPSSPAVSLTSLSSATMPSLQSTADSPRKKRRQTSPGLSPTESRALKPISVKRDPMASLFLPKHRAHSQRIN
ncbi:RNA polymerase II transcription factor SIII subunit A-domain-containing protein [Mycena maculata]|uniref:RNA polymerase II transcription factor SIII subunit A-domain-containing protein n=1 Tax=Mycena maculata TaxID=230809 RepID=A0AAD7IKM0_9AGAR|nr:RNA polymerase II transcription factor SIII subunit A-domain-containing protein [Mycena maculata]